MALTREPCPDGKVATLSSISCLPDQSTRDLICIVDKPSSTNMEYVKSRPPQQGANDAEARKLQQRAERSPVTGDETVLTSCLSACFGYPVTGGKRYKSRSKSRQGGMVGQESDPILRKPIVRRQHSKCFISILRCWCVPGLDPDSSDEDDEDNMAKASFSTSPISSLPCQKTSSHGTPELAVP